MMKGPGNKGISMVIDLAFAVFIFLLISWSLTTIWSNKTALLEGQAYEDETILLAERALDTLVTSGGFPSDWENRLIHDVNIIGLAETDRVLDENKVNRFLGFGKDESVRDGLAGFWSFDIDGRDDSGNGNIGTVNGASQTTGLFGQAYDFDGGDDYIEVAHSASLDIADEITLVAWIYPETFNESYENSILTKAGDGDWGVWSLHHKTTSNGYRFELNNGSMQTLFESVPSSTLNRWYHVAGVYDGSELRFYINGQLSNSMPVSGAITTNTFPLRIGKQFWWDTTYSYWDGKIDEPAVFGRALSQSEVQSIMRNGVFWDIKSTKQKLLIGANDYYFRLIDPDTGNVVRNRDGEYIRVGQEPDSTWLQAMVRRPVVFSYRKDGDAEAAPHEAIAELTLYLQHRTW